MFWVCCVLCTLLMAGVILVKGHVTGSEFAPSHFQTRDFSFYEIPFLHLQITPIRRNVATDPTARQIRGASLITVPRGKPPTTWHLVELWRGPTGTPAIAGLLTAELGLEGSQGLFWKQWNQQFPARASVLWPVVQRLAQRELYLLVPELLQLARSQRGGDDATELAAAIDAWLIEQYSELIVDLRAAKRTELADELLQEAVTDYPEASQLDSLRNAPQVNE
ncbi:hypothetical protein NHH03_08260 [Stieleria sp. TO1_6]|uniref:hypothetical protein n=1 Tax=Stieleria tagensis TaxID=2956795 RepID=UPI00209AD6FA|nr:hypothetical protein [Stieleria tagensis]MCO8121726.1 hypothetical protein [Stieleria tagensis]